MKIVKKYEISISGMNPVIYNRMKKEIEDEKKKLKKNELQEWEEKNWIKKADWNDDGELVLPKEWFKGMLLNACKQTRLVPHFATSKKSTFTSYIGGCLIDDSIFYRDGRAATKDDLHAFGAYMPAQPGSANRSKVWRVRPMLDEPWSAKIIFVDVYGRMKKSELEELVEYGGMYIGIGDSRKEGYGRFDVSSIEVIG